jgi:hypothetical protein
MTNLLAALEANLDDPNWLDMATTAMRRIVERYRSAPIDPLNHDRNVESLDRLADLVHQYNVRLQALPGRGRPDC